MCGGVWVLRFVNRVCAEGRAPEGAWSCGFRVGCVWSVACYFTLVWRVVLVYLWRVWEQLGLSRRGLWVVLGGATEKTDPLRASV